MIDQFYDLVAVFLIIFVNSMIHRYIVSDCNAVPIIYQQQGYAKTPEDAVADVLNAGNPEPIYYFR